MRKYVTVFLIAWRRIMVYRGVNLVFVAIQLVNIVLTLGIWTVAYKNPHFLSSETFGTLIAYFMLAILLNRVVLSWNFDEIAEWHIKQGELSHFLLKPFPYILYMFILELPWRILQFFLVIPLFIIMTFLFNGVVTFHIPFVLLAIGIGLVSYFISFFLQTIFAFSTFWFEDTQGVSTLLEITQLLFSGIGIPIFFFPPLLKTISSVLPFQYMYYFPVTVGLGRLSILEIGINISIVIVWIVILGIITKYVWQKGLQRFTGEGL